MNLSPGIAYYSPYRRPRFHICISSRVLETPLRSITSTRTSAALRRLIFPVFHFHTSTHKSAVRRTSFAHLHFTSTRRNVDTSLFFQHHPSRPHHHPLPLSAATPRRPLVGCGVFATIGAGRKSCVTFGLL